MMTSLLIIGAILAIAAAGAVTGLTLTENARHRRSWRPRVRHWRPNVPRPTVPRSTVASPTVPQQAPTTTRRRARALRPRVVRIRVPRQRKPDSELQR
jgi:hypothetical protein